MQHLLLSQTVNLTTISGQDPEICRAKLFRALPASVDPPTPSGSQRATQKKKGVSRGLGGGRKVMLGDVHGAFYARLYFVPQI